MRLIGCAIEAESSLIAVPMVLACPEGIPDGVRSTGGRILDRRPAPAADAYPLESRDQAGTVELVPAPSEERLPIH